MEGGRAVWYEKHWRWMEIGEAFWGSAARYLKAKTKWKKTLTAKSYLKLWGSKQKQNEQKTMKLTFSCQVEGPGSHSQVEIFILGWWLWWSGWGRRWWWSGWWFKGRRADQYNRSSLIDLLWSLITSLIIQTSHRWAVLYTVYSTLHCMLYSMREIRMQVQIQM